MFFFTGGESEDFVDAGKSDEAELVRWCFFGFFGNMLTEGRQVVLDHGWIMGPEVIDVFHDFMFPVAVKLLRDTPGLEVSEHTRQVIQFDQVFVVLCIDKELAIADVKYGRFTRAHDTYDTQNRRQVYM